MPAANPGLPVVQLIDTGLGLFNININGLIGGGTVPLLSGSSRMMTYIQGAGWRAG